MTYFSAAVEIGGYHGMTLDKGVPIEALASAQRFQSGRAAIAAILQRAAPTAIWAPHYLCGAVNDALAYSRVPTYRYNLSDTWSVPDNIRLKDSEWILCVDYFGVCGAQIDEALDRFRPERVLVDASQSLFRIPRHGAATVYSPRKFVGLPDGGLLMSTMAPDAGPANTLASVERCKHLLLRAALETSLGYEAFAESERTLVSCKPEQMSSLTSRILDSIDFSRVSTQRTENYRTLAALLTEAGMRVADMPADTVPLCVPVLGVGATRLKKELINYGIFTPTYWPDCFLPPEDTVSLSLRDNTVFLPCDQRYGNAEMIYISSTLSQLLGNA